MMRWLPVAALIAACGGSVNGVASNSEALLPSDDKLCDVWLGYEIGAVTVLGTHSDDVRAVLGEPAKRTDTEFTYDWCVGADCAKRVSAVLTFTQNNRCYADSGKTVTPPYWLHDVKVEGMTLPKCWIVGSEMPQNCTECLNPETTVACK